MFCQKLVLGYLRTGEGKKQRSSVRSWSIFRQGKGKSKGLCPKLRYLRTREVGFKGVVSEVRVSSDKGKQDHRCSVRSWSIFRQGKAKSKELCPKLRYLQTGEDELKGEVSEVGVSSDKERRNQRSYVQS